MQFRFALALTATALALAAPTLAQQSSSVATLQAPTDLNTFSQVPHDLSVTPDGTRAVLSFGGRVELIDMATGATLASDGGPGAATNGFNTMAHSVGTTNDRAIVVGLTGNVEIYDISTGALTPVSSFAPGFVNGELAKEVAVTPSTDRAVVVYQAAETLVFDLKTGAILNAAGALPSAGAVYGTNPNLNALRVTDTHAVVVGNVIRVFDIAAASPIEITPPAVSSLPQSAYYDVEISPDGMRAIARATGNTPNTNSHSIALRTVGGVMSAAYEQAFAWPGATTMTLNFANQVNPPTVPPTPPQMVPYTRAILEDSIVMSNDKAMILGITPGSDEATSLANVQVIDFAASPTVLTTFTQPGFAHDLDLSPDGTRGVVHSSLEVGVYDPAAAGGAAKLGALLSPGNGMVTYVFTNPFGEIVNDDFHLAPNTVAVRGDRAIVIGNDMFTSSSSTGGIVVYDLDPIGGAPSVLSSYDSVNDTIGGILQEVQTTPQGGLAGIASDDQTDYVEMATGNLVGSLAAGGTFENDMVHGIELSNTRTARIGLSFTSLPQYSVDQVSQLPYNQGTPLPNTTGGPTLLSATGSLSQAANNLSLVATGIPTTGGVPQSQGLMFYSFGLNGPTPLNDGLLFIGPALFRVTPNPVPITSDPYVLPIDLNALPAGGPIGAFQEVHFQLWYRDNASPNGANLSDVLTISYGL